MQKLDIKVTKDNFHDCTTVLSVTGFSCLEGEYRVKIAIYTYLPSRRQSIKFVKYCINNGISSPVIAAYRRDGSKNTWEIKA